MNIPITKPLLENVMLEKLVPDKLFLDLASKQFSGYSYLVFSGSYGFEESILIFSRGNVIGAIYLVDSFGKEYFGEEAFALSSNAFGNKNGILNVYELNDDQIKLLLIFNDKIKFNFEVNKKNLSKLNFNFDNKKIDELLKKEINIEESRLDILDKYRLAELLKT